MTQLQGEHHKLTQLQYEHFSIFSKYYYYAFKFLGGLQV